VINNHFSLKLNDDVERAITLQVGLQYTNSRLDVSGANWRNNVNFIIIYFYSNAFDSNNDRIIILCTKR
jgi:hypothetical protein